MNKFPGPLPSTFMVRVKNAKDVWLCSQPLGSRENAEKWLRKEIASDIRMWKSEEPTKAEILAERDLYEIVELSPTPTSPTVLGMQTAVPLDEIVAYRDGFAAYRDGFAANPTVFASPYAERRLALRYFDGFNDAQLVAFGHPRCYPELTAAL